MLNNKSKIVYVRKSTGRETEMTIELVKILEAAKEYNRRSMIWFDLYRESNDKFDWQTCMELSDKCDAMLEAYEILTGKKIYKAEIDNELAIC